MTDHSDWEFFQDEGYFGMWCVREKGARRFGEGFHTVSEEEAEALASALSSQSLSLSEAREEIERLRRESADRLKCMDRRADRLIDLWDRVNAAERALGPFAAVASVDIGSDETDEDIFQQPGHYHRAPRITVGNMRRARTALEICKSGLADATNDPSSSDLSSLRKGAEVVGEAAAYDFVAGWHGRQAKLFREMAEDDPRTAEPQRKRAFEAAIHHAASAAALRNRAADYRRAALVSGSREDGASLLRTIETLPDDFTDDGNCCAGKLKEPRP